MSKATIREKYKVLRKGLSQEMLEEKSMAIANRVLSLDIWDKTYYHLYLSIEAQKEVDTSYILSILHGKDKRVVVPATNFEDGTLTHFLLMDDTLIRTNARGIPEPVEGIAIEATKIEVVFVPLLAFDDSGNRLGYGKGFYDRFLAQCAPSVLTIGLSFFPAEKSLTGMEETDVPLDYCVTPEKVYVFSSEDSS